MSRWSLSALEMELVFELRAWHLPKPETQFRFAPPRRWRFDLCWPDRMLAAEIDGGTWIRGRHSRGKGHRADAEKQNAAVAAGWKVLRFTSDMVRDGSAFRTLREVLR